MVDNVTPEVVEGRGMHNHADHVSDIAAFNLLMSPLTDEAPQNTRLMSVTLVTSHLLRSPLRDEAGAITRFMSVTSAPFHLAPEARRHKPH